MGRHSIPEPDDSDDEPQEWSASDYGRQGYEPAPEQDEFGYLREPRDWANEHEDSAEGDWDEAEDPLLGDWDRPGEQQPAEWESPGEQLLGEWDRSGEEQPAEWERTADQLLGDWDHPGEPQPGEWEAPTEQQPAQWAASGEPLLGDWDRPGEQQPGEWDRPTEQLRTNWPEREQQEWPAEPAPTLPPPPPPPGRRSRAAVGDWEGGHRKDGPRGVSVGVIIALVVVVVGVTGVIGWRFFGDVLSHRSNVAASQCLGGEQPLPVVVDSAIADQITQLADRYNKTASPIGDRCVRVGVKSGNSGDVIKGFTDQWPADMGDKPALWIPGSSVSVARLESVRGPQIVSDSRSLVTSPIVLAIKPQLNAALANQNWGTLPGLQSNPTALDQLNMPGWGSLRLALPTVGDSDATYLAAEAVAAASAPQGAPVTAGLGAVSTLLGGQPKLDNPDLSTAIDALLADGDPAAGQVHAVVITEQQLYQRATEMDDAKDKVASWLPPGPVALADFPTALLAGDWLTEEQVTAASEFARFLREPEQMADLAGAGFRAEGASLPTSDVTSFAPLAEPLKVGDDGVRVVLSDAVNSPSGGSSTIIVLDRSMTKTEGPNTRMGNVVDDLMARIPQLPPTSVVGLWTFNGVEGRSEVVPGPLSQPVDGKLRSDDLVSTLDAQRSTSGGTVSFTTLPPVYDEAKANFQPSMENSVLFITGGPHTDKTLDGPGLEDYMRKNFDPAKPVAVNIIDFGDDDDRATWESVAQISGGSYQNLATSDSPELSAAIAQLLR